MRCVPSIAFQGANRSLFRWHWRLACLPSHPTGCRVESLFIDEGFGSLDAETLRVAMDALESLRTQGRKIGVISHVQEMTERIPVRICVNRAGNGRSFLEVL